MKSPDKPRDLPPVIIRKPRCPYCDSTKIKTMSSRLTSSGELRIRRCRCQCCNLPFKIFVEE